MQDTTSNNKRIAKNTIMLYIRMFISMVVGLYTSRVVLATLGVEDYGIYGVVGGVVAMMGFLNASMSGATSRFLTFELGRGDKDRLAKTFSSALIVHIAIAIIVFILAETVGLWFLCNKLNIPEGRMEAAHWVYQFSILATMLSITQVPYNATIIAHEKMDVYAYMEILNVTLKLLIVYLLTIGDFDKLKLYAVLTFAVSLIIMMIYRIYCLRHFKESRFHWVWDKEYITPLLSFSVWDLYGNLSWTVKQQGTSFALNAFYGVALNAANGIASTVQGILMGFSSNIIMAFKPAIIKNYAVGSYEEMNRLMCFATKMAVGMLMLSTFIIYIKMNYILELWLKEVPTSTVILCRYSLIMNLFSCISLILIVGFHAVGKVKLMGFINGTISILSIPLMYIMLKDGFDYENCFQMFVLLQIFFCVSNLILLKKQCKHFHIKKYIKSALFPSLLSVSLIYLILNYISALFVDNIIGLIEFSFCATIITMSVCFLVMMNSNDRIEILQNIRSKIQQK